MRGEIDIDSIFLEDIMVVGNTRREKSSVEMEIRQSGRMARL
jgi:hypothetical protein